MSHLKKVISYPSIDQFRNCVASINRRYNFVGLDENGQAIYDVSKPKPTILMTGTVKLHGTNLGVSYNDEDGIWPQSRENLIDVQKDNAGSAMFVYGKRDAFMNLFNQIKSKYNIDTSIFTITIYCEWVGKGIQSKVAISEIPKSAFIIGIKISNLNDKEFVAYFVDASGFKDTENRIYNILDYKTFSIEIDFNTPQLSQNQIIEWTIEVEKECPVAKEFGVSGIGEGIVFSCDYDNQTWRFKSKGELHSKSKVKTLNPVDDEKIKKVIEIAEKVTPEWRLEQMLEQTFDLNNGGVIDRTKLGDFMRALFNDIIKEELDVLAEAGLEPKEISKYVSEIGRKYFFEKEKV